MSITKSKTSSKTTMAIGIYGPSRQDGVISSNQYKSFNRNFFLSFPLQFNDSKSLLIWNPEVFWLGFMKAKFFGPARDSTKEIETSLISQKIAKVK